MLLPAFGLPMIGERDVALGAQLGHGLEQVGRPFRATSADAVVIRRPGHAGDLGQRPEQLRVDADGHEAHAVVGDAHVGVDVVDRVLADDDDARHPRRDPALHLDERVPAADRPALAPVRRVVHLQLAVLRDRVVQRDDGRDALLELEDPVAEALVVVDEVELAARAACSARRAR